MTTLTDPSQTPARAPAGAAAPGNPSWDRWRGRLRRHAVAIMLGAAVVLVLYGYVIAPMVATVRSSLDDGRGGSTLKNYRDFFDLADNAQIQAMLGSIGISLASVVTSGFVGVGVAILLSRFSFPLKRFCQVLVLLPIALPPLMGVEAFVLLFGLGGVVPRTLETVLGIDPSTVTVSGVGGVLITHTFTMYPYFYLTAAAALMNGDGSLEEAAYSLGASRLRVWARVLLPMLTPAIIAGALLTFMSSMSSYTAPLLFGWDNVMTRQIVLAKTNGNTQMAATIATVLAVISIVFLVVVRRMESRKVYRSTSKGSIRRSARVSLPWVRIVMMIVVVAITIVLLAPILLIGVLAFAREGSWRQGILPSSYTWDNVLALFRDPSTLTPVLTSLKMSAVAVGAALLLGVVAAYVLSRYSFRGKWIIDVCLMLPWALPGTVVAINLISSFSFPNPFALGEVLVGSFWIVPLAYFVRFSPLIFRSTSAAMAQFDISVEEAARSLGARWFTAFRRVVLPNLWAGILAGALLAFVDGVGEFVASVLLYTPSSQPLSIAIYNALYGAKFGIAAVYGMIQVLLVLGAVWLSRRVQSRDDAMTTLR